MVQIQSTWFPLIDRNPQKFTNIYEAKQSDFRAATQRIHRSGSRASHLVVPIAPRRRTTNDASGSIQNRPEGSRRARVRCSSAPLQPAACRR